MINLKEYRNIFYHRVGGLSCLLKWYAPEVPLFHLGVAKNQAVGLVVHHGHSSRLGPDKIGENCQIWHNVTAGRAISGGPRPIIGNNVKLCTGVIVLGGVTIGDNVTLAAGTIVNKNVPDNCLVVGNPARIVRKNGEKVNIPL